MQRVKPAATYSTTSNDNKIQPECQFNPIPYAPNAVTSYISR